MSRSIKRNVEFCETERLEDKMQDTIMKREFQMRSDAHDLLYSLTSFGYQRIRHDAALQLGCVKCYQRADGSWAVEWNAYEAN